MILKSLFTIPFLFIGLIGFSQETLNLIELKPEKEDNIVVKKTFTDKNGSSFVIWIKEGVKLHKHDFHSEHVYIMRGKGEMVLGEKVIQIRKGDLVFIPEGTPHSVKVKGMRMKVLSIQGPEFSGKDRVFIN